MVAVVPLVAIVVLLFLWLFSDKEEDDDEDGVVVVVEYSSLITSVTFIFCGDRAVIVNVFGSTPTDEATPISID